MTAGRIAGLLTILLTAGGVPALAQVGAAPPLPAELTLEQALSIARERHPAFAVHRARLDAADADERSTEWWLRLLPPIRFDVNSMVTQSRILTGFDEFGRPIRLEDPISNRRTDSAMGPAIGQVTLFDGGAGLRSARSTRAGVRSARAGVAADARQLEVRLIRAYYGAAQRERVVAVEERLQASTRLNLEAAERLLRVGIQDPLDLLGAELALAEAEHRLEIARGEARKARLALADAMGIGQELEFTLSDALPEVFDPEGLDADELVRAARNAHPSVVQLEGSAEQSRYALMDAQVRRWPTVSAFLSTRMGDTRGSGSDPTFYLNPLNQTYTLGVSFSVNLFDRFQASTRVAQARAAHVLQTENLRRGQLQAEIDVRGLIIDLTSTYRALRLQDRTADLARQRLELSQEKYRLGTLSFNELQSSLDQAFQAEHAALSARFDFVTMLLALEEAAGIPVR